MGSVRAARRAGRRLARIANGEKDSEHERERHGIEGTDAVENRRHEPGHDEREREPHGKAGAGEPEPFGQDQVGDVAPRRAQGHEDRSPAFGRRRAGARQCSSP
jgi:hypothetical protein